MFDSEYVKPIENSRVIQDSDPCKTAAYNEALKRYEDGLKMKGEQIKQDYVKATDS